MHFREYVQATGINVLFTFCIFLYYPVLSPYIKSIGLDDFQTSLIFALMPLATIFSSPVMGKLADNIGRIRVIIIGLIIQISSMALYIYGRNWIVFAAARVLEAVAVAAVIIVVLAKIEDALTDDERGKYAGWSLSLRQIGALIGPVVGGLMADYLFIQAPFILSFMVLLALAFMLAFRIKKSHRKIRKDCFNLRNSLKDFISVRQLKGMGILGVVIHASNPAILVFLPLFIIERFNLSYSYVGVALFFFGIANLFQFYFGHLTNRFGRAHMVLLGCSVFAMFLFLLSFAESYWLLLVFLFLMGIGGAVWNVSALTLLSDVGEKIKKEGEVMGSYMSIAKIGAFVSFVFSGLIVQIFNIETLFMLNAFIISIGIFAASFFFDRKEIFSDKHAKPL